MEGIVPKLSNRLQWWFIISKSKPVLKFWSFQSEFVCLESVEILKELLDEKSKMKLLTEVSQNSNQVYWCWSNTKWCSWKSYSSFPEMPQSCSHSWLTASREISENQIYHSSVTDGQMRSQGISTQMPRYTSHMREVKSVLICSMVPTVWRQCLVHNTWLHSSLGGKEPCRKIYTMA